MNATTQTHPAESPEFLSRLQDGELSPAEAASFEEHRRGCARCREAADSYARALSIFRSASPRPAPSDLSARILRKVRAQAPSRRPFGVTFGIDVRWAGVCAAALVVVIMAASILDEGPAPSIVLPPPPSEPASVRAHLLEKESAPADKKARRAEAAAAPSSPEAARPAPPAVSEKIGQRRDALAAAAPSNLPRQAPAPASGAPQASAAYAPAPQAVVVQGEAPLVDSPASTESRYQTDGLNTAAPPAAAKEGDRAAANVAPETARSKVSREAPRSPAAPAREEQKTAALAAPSSRARAYTDAPGGEAGAAGAAGEGVRVIVEAADGLGGAPALQPGADDAALSPFRGREFVLVVESGGRVRSAAVWGESGTLRDLRANANAKAKDERESLSPFLELRFAPGERPRRLRVRIE